MKLRILKRVGLTITLIASVLGATGCSTIDNAESELADRAAVNIGAVDDIYKAGLISEELAISIKDSIEYNKDILNTMDILDLRKYVVRDVDSGEEQPVEDDSDVEAYPLLSADDDNIKELLDILDYNIYVLKRNPLGTGDTANDLATMDTINKAIESAISKDDKSKSNDDRAAQNLIDAYFVKTPYKVWDTTKPENQLIKNTVTSGTVIRIGCERDDPSGNPMTAVNENQQHLILVNTRNCHCECEDHDDCHTELEHAYEIKLNEFNIDAVGRLIGGEGVNKNKYVVIGTNCYLMEYPVYYVEGFETQDNKVYTSTYQKSDMKVNLLTKKITYKDGRECIVGNKGGILSVTGNTSSKYTDLGQASFIVDGIKGEPPTEGYLKLKEGQTEADVLTEDVLNSFGRIVLRDYLELTYMPNVVEGDMMAALGRRIRLTRFTGTGDEIIGLFVDKAGNKVSNSLDIKITDFMDISEGLDAGEKHKLKIEDATEDSEDSSSSESTENTESIESIDGSSSGDSDPAEVEGIGISHNRLLNEVHVNKIITTTRFPGDIIDKIDTIEDVSSLDTSTNVGEDGATGTTGSVEDTSENTEESSDSSGEESTAPVEGVKQFFYAMAVDIDPFQSNLFSGWINAVGEDTETGNLDWWNAWLKSASYKYRVDREAVIDFFTGNYSLEMNGDDYIILDVNTLTDIQKEIDTNERVKSTSLISTLFVILGFLLIAYSTLLLGAWVYDVNIVAGPRLLGLITGGRWEALADRDTAGLPNLDTSGKHYMNFGKTLQSAIVIICVGVALIFVDIIDIIDTLIIVFGKLAEVFSRIIQGF